MAIGFRGTATATGGNPSVTVAVPTGTTVGDIILVAGTWTTATTGASLPAGWNVLYQDSWCIIGWRAYQGGDASTIVVNSGGSSSFMVASAISYSGCDTGNPIDAYGHHAIVRSDGTAGTSSTYRTPTLNPRYNGSMLVNLILDRNNSSGMGAPTWAGGLTQRHVQTFGPGIAIADKALTDGTPTGYLDHTWSARFYHLGVAIALKASGASAATVAAPRPVLAGNALRSNTNAGSHTVNLDYLGIKDGDLVVVCMGAATTITPPTGYGAVEVSAGRGGVYTHIWHTGDTLSPTFNFSANSYSMATVVLVRAQPNSAGIYLDASGTNTGTGAVSTPSKTPTTALDLLLAFFYEGNSATGTWTATPALTNDVASSMGPVQLFGWKAPSDVPSGSYAVTNAASTKTLAGSVLLLRDGAAPPIGGSSRGHIKPKPWQRGSIRGNSYKRPT